jgi:hypothetical protein
MADLESNNTKNSNTRTLRQPGKKNSGCGGCLLFIIIFLAALGGLYYFWKTKNPDATLPGAEILSTLKFPGLGGANNETPNEANPNTGNFSQNEPIQFQGNKNPGNRKQNNGQAKQATGEVNSNLSSPNSRNSKYINQANNDPEAVPSGYPFNAPLQNRTANNQQNASAKSSSYIYDLGFKNLIPSKHAIPVSIDSLILDSRSMVPTNPNSRASLAVHPNKIITMESPIYSADEAIDEYSQKLAKLGFSRVSIPINDYNKGGTTVLQSYNKKGQQILMSFKPTKDLTRTSWKFEIYFDKVMENKY